ncbi:hypothetical protein J5T34_14620 [Cupriavidus gilardii]|uniref:hypothetical protein n=1 Tax=Cupriavidus gilardii TaxID=82541 RepID=UPI001ABE685F|nr:hypothetical protein [Cupriavidus gilardii]MBO4121957.1 hypothetical protein [Cupriavidus gilardii]
MPTYINIAGTDFDISHLAPYRTVVDVPLRGGNVKRMPVEIAYTNHCYSRRPIHAVNEQIPVGYLIRDGAKARMFCSRRYRLSLNLPLIMDALIRGETQVWSVAGNNFVRVEMVDEEADGRRTTINYYVLMQIRKHAAPEQPKHIKVRVETAFPEDLLYYDKPVLKKPFSFRKLLACAWEGRDHNDRAPKPNKKDMGAK